MRTTIGYGLLLVATTSAGPSLACTYIPPSVVDVISQVSREGMLISGHVIQGFDAEKEQPEIIRADQIFIGEGRPREFAIYRSPSFYQDVRNYEQRLLKRGYPSGRDCSLSPTFSKGQIVERLVLVPTETKVKNHTGKWTIHFWGRNVSTGQSLEILLREASKQGRFQAHPPKSRNWGDCMDCIEPGKRP